MQSVNVRTAMPHAAPPCRNPCSRNMRNLPARTFAVRNRGKNADNHKMNCKPRAETELARGYAEAQRSIAAQRK